MSDRNLPCKRCGEVMTGVNNYELRTKCDACGGNETEFSFDNPNPESPLGRELKSAKRNG